MIDSRAASSGIAAPSGLPGGLATSTGTGEMAMHRAGCRREDHPGIGRRELLQVGGLGLLGASLADLLRLEACASPRAIVPKARSVVFIFQSGGPSQHETFDPKPEAPEG